MTPPFESSEPRRSFVKKTLATSVSISFAGLIRAHGEEGGETTVPETAGTTVPETAGTTYASTAEETAGTTSTTNPSTELPVLRYYIVGYPAGEQGSPDGYSQKLKQFGATGYIMKLKVWCNPDNSDFEKLVLTSTCEFYGNGQLFTCADDRLTFSGAKGSATDWEFPDGQPKLENTTGTIAKSWLTGVQGSSDFRKWVIKISLTGIRSDPVPQSFPPRYVVKLNLTGTLEEYKPGDPSWELVVSRKETLFEDLELTIVPEVV